MVIKCIPVISITCVDPRVTWMCEVFFYKFPTVLLLRNSLITKYTIKGGGKVLTWELTGNIFTCVGISDRGDSPRLCKTRMQHCLCVCVCGLE